MASHPDQPLDKPEQFLFELSEIPHFGERVACLIFQSDFNDALNNIASKLNNMKATSGVSIKRVRDDETQLRNDTNSDGVGRGGSDNAYDICSQLLMTSESLKKVLAIILALGNYMNGGNRQRGQADGFGLEILPKLRDVKSKGR